MLCGVHLKNYCAGKTTNERFAKKARSSSIASETESNDSYLEENSAGEKLIQKDGNRRRTKKGCCGNCYTMWCNKKIPTQESLLKIHMAESALSSRTDQSDLIAID